MALTPRPSAPRLPQDGRLPHRSDTRGDGFEGGCLSLLVLLLEIPVALLLGLALMLRGWGRSSEYMNSKVRTEPPPMDWVPTLWFGGFTLAVLVIAVVFLRTAHPYAGSVQLLLAALALIVTVATWPGSYERAHPASPPCPAWAGPCAPVDPTRPAQ
ncbi:DUF6234 family protein [Streptomyces sp. NBC_00872]|uniref:DUF6234 family protein n=1 Tax=Streptomyces sp. NBC_00872 TaxID=2903686 RepID=UPI00386F9A1F|nr:DUF6234 family protein [Streptomyces sp. NBC_00872]